MITLGIESTAHTLGIGICEGGKILSNCMDTYKPKNEGIIPRKAADHHADVFYSILKTSLSEAKLSIREIDLIAFAQGPGIGAPLAVGVNGAKYLAGKFGKKLIGVNHGYAHMKISEHLTGLKNPIYLYVSGGNTQILVEEQAGPHVLGETLDIGIGNLFDSFGRVIGLEYAHGSVLEALAKQGKYVELPYTVKGMNLVFSGLLTQAGKLFKAGVSKEDLAYSIMETSFSMVGEATERALFLTKKKNLVVCGGVAQNKRLQIMLRTMCDEDGVRFGVAPDEFNRDNGAMIAYTGELLYKKWGAKPVEYWKAITRYRMEMMEKIL
ncbi:tRNA (adenosine(37)-N6)-threonylcarbamoyltransferase complex transferase subunit TsaD [Candidatus Micrarchaeota archaeon]|nr:tRNA (adenosine(37)-N6)-threonylcarbamoyltransferase complex transferase subunit TsaD [Candidatus Micrarchaeota archaeon]